MNRIAANSRSIPVPGGFLVAISYPHDATPRSQGRTSENASSRTLVKNEQDGVLISSSDYQDGTVSMPDDRVGDAAHKRALYAA
jgi:hypothetical protein